MPRLVWGLGGGAQESNLAAGRPHAGLLYKPSPHRCGKLPASVANHETDNYEEYPNGEGNTANEVGASLCLPKSRGVSNDHVHSSIRVEDKLVAALAVGHRLAGTWLLVRVSGDCDSITGSKALLLEDSGGIGVATQRQECMRSFPRVGRHSLEARRVRDERPINTPHQRPSAGPVVDQERFAVTFLGHRRPQFTSPSFSRPARASNHAAQTHAKPDHGPPAARRDERATLAWHYGTLDAQGAVAGRVGYGRLRGREKPACGHRLRTMPVHDDDARHEEHHAYADQHHPEHLGWLSRLDFVGMMSGELVARCGRHGVQVGAMTGGAEGNLRASAPTTRHH